MIFINPETLQRQKNKGKKTHVCTWVLFVGLLLVLGLHSIAFIVGGLWGVVLVIHLLQ